MSGMDDEEQRRRQYRQAFHEPTRTGGSVTSGAGDLRGRPSTNSANRARHAQPIPNTTSLPNVEGYGYATAQQYQSQQAQGQAFAYQTPFPQNPQRSQQYPQYPQQMFYAMPQHAHGQNQHPTALGDPLPYQQRQSTAVEVLSTHFGGQNYYNTNESQAPATANLYPGASFQQSVQYQPSTELSQPPLISDFTPTDSNLVSPASDFPQRQQSQSTPDTLAALGQLLRQANSLTTQGRLLEARQPLLTMSQRLVDNVESLGLTRDIVIEGLEGRAAYRERLEFWRNIHYCWLAFLQRQLDSTQTRQAASSNRRSAPRALDASLLEELGDKVVEFSDALEKSGLVDYEMGFFEAELIALIIKCIKALSSEDSTPA